MILFISLIFILLIFYWASMLKFISGTKLLNNKEEVPFGIPGASTETKNYLRVKQIVENEIGFLLEIDWYSCD